jgi:formate hydrogenlyase transcriptional activator
MAKSQKIKADSNTSFTQAELLQLLEINRAITHARTATELLTTIKEIVSQLIPFNDTGVFIVEKDGHHHYDMSVNIAGWDNSECNVLLQQQKDLYKVAHVGSYVEFVMDKLEKKDSPIIEDWDITFENWEHPFFPIAKEIGNKESIVALLKSGGITYGTLWLNSLTKNHFRKEQFSLFMAVTDLVAVAVANILANEEIVEQTKEKDVLLNISQKLSKAAKPDELLQIIISEVKPIFNFYDTSILVIDETANGFYDLSVVYPHIDNSEVNDFLNSKGYYRDNVLLKLENSVLEWLLQQFNPDKPLNVFDYLQDYSSYSDGSLLTDLRNGGYVSAWICPLVQHGKAFGILTLNYKKDSSIPLEKQTLFLALADRIASSLANILANEEILEREKEKALLYKIASSIANVNDRNTLMKVILEEIKSIFNFYDVGLPVLDKDEINCTDWSTFYPDIDPSDVNYEGYILNLSKLPFKDSLFEKSIREVEVAGHPLILKFDEQLKNDNPDLKELLELAINHGYKECLFTYLKSGDKIIGVFSINSLTDNHFKPAQFHLFQAVADLVAVAVANILAKEEILTKAKEIENLNKQLLAQNEYLLEEVEQVYNFDEMIGQNAQFREVCKNIGLVAHTDSTVLILGETGTGKELVARAIHNNSPRKGKPLIKLNCAALPASLIESELFGHERGAFTGAIERRIGKFELASGSTLFLDEVGELPIELQAKLLRALQEKEIERLGSNKTLQIDVRIIAATNRDLTKAIPEGKFRQDLYYRLHIFPITLPSLRERKEDIPLLAAHFLERYSKKIGKKIQGFGSNAMQEMMSYNWPGNIRELEHVIERSVVLSLAKLIQTLNLPDVSKKRTTISASEFVIKTWEEQERDYILEILKLTNGNMAGKGGAAELLKLPPTTLQSKMKKLGIKRKHFLVEKDNGE